jgi:hypothetical protein
MSRWSEALTWVRRASGTAALHADLVKDRWH